MTPPASTAPGAEDGGMSAAAPCDLCNLPTPIDLLDGKPPRHDPKAADWTTFECPACYGPGYLPGGWATWLDALALAAERGVTLIERRP